MKVSNQFLQNVDSHIPYYIQEVTTPQSQSHQAFNVQIREGADSLGGTLIIFYTYSLESG